MDTLTDLFEAFGGSTAVAHALGVIPSTASEMKRRRSVPVRHWPRLIAAAREKGIRIDEAKLVSIHCRDAA